MAVATTFSSSNYTGGRKGLSQASGGKLSRSGRYVTREQVRGQLRSALGVKG